MLGIRLKEDLRCARFVVIEFPTFEQAVTCFNSAEYKNAAAFRRDGAAGEAEIAFVEAVE
jgi:uncharacterized protein (DUF1330 family)